LVIDDRTPRSRGDTILRLPQGVSITPPASAATTAITSSVLLPEGRANALARLLPDQAKKTTISTMCAMPPARLFRPTAATAVAPSTPDFCRYRAFNAIPPTLAGVTRLANEDAS